MIHVGSMLNQFNSKRMGPVDLHHYSYHGCCMDSAYDCQEYGNFKISSLYQLMKLLSMNIF